MFEILASPRSLLGPLGSLLVSPSPTTGLGGKQLPSSIAPFFAPQTQLNFTQLNTPQLNSIHLTF